MRERVVEVKLPGRGYRVIIGEGLLDNIGRLMSAEIAPGKTLLVSDTRVHGLYGERCRLSLEREGWKVHTVTVRPGERSKSLSAAARLYDAAAGAGLYRGSPVVALGGGVVGDLAGFLAATYMRGVPLVMAPTTLLAQVDSSVGGKVAVNLPRGKNLVGAFHQPRLVAADLSVLATLPRRQLAAGAAEVVKCSIIAGSPFFEWMEQHLDAVLANNTSLLAEAVERSIRVKAAVVQKDEREDGYRRILNFGHTVGHALEAATSYRHYLHGEAVAVGMSAAVDLAGRLGLLDAGESARIHALLRRIGLRAAPPELTAVPVLKALGHDKKKRGEKILFILPRSIGAPVDYAVSPQEPLVEQVVRDYLERKAPFG